MKTSRISHVQTQATTQNLCFVALFWLDTIWSHRSEWDKYLYTSKEGVIRLWDNFTY